MLSDTKDVLILRNDVLEHGSTQMCVPFEPQNAPAGSPEEQPQWQHLSFAGPPAAAVLSNPALSLASDPIRSVARPSLCFIIGYVCDPSFKQNTF
jgi:hypothetical protein